MREFPHLKTAIEDEYLFWSESIANPYPHLFLETFLLRILIGEIEANRKRAGEILDELLVSPDEDLASAALMSVLLHIARSPELREAARPWLGPTATEWLARLSRQTSGAS